MSEMQRLADIDLEMVRKTEIMANEVQRKADNIKSVAADNLDEDDDIIELAVQKVKLWLTNRFGDPDLIELLIPTDDLSMHYT